MRLPDHQLEWLCGGISVFETEYRFFREQRINDDKLGLFLPDILQRHINPGIPFFAILVMQHGVAMRKGAAATILAAHAHRISGRHQRSIGEIFGHTPIERLFTAAHLAPGFQQFFDRHVQLEV